MRDLAHKGQLPGVKKKPVGKKTKIFLKRVILARFFVKVKIKNKRKELKNGEVSFY